MRILVVADRFPWPITGGGFMRLARTIEALSEVGEVQLFHLAERNRDDHVVPPDVSLSRVGSAPYPEPSPAWRWRASWLTHGGIPLEIATRLADAAPRLAFESWAEDRYDLVWFLPLAPFVWLGRPDRGPTVIDLDNLESEKERQRARLIGQSVRTRRPLDRARVAVAAAQARLNARDWDALQRASASRVARSLLCSDVDVRRSGLLDATIVPNAYERPEQPLGRTKVAEPPVILFQGSLEYGPNADAATWLADELAPRITSRVPAATIRLVGTAPPGLSEQLSRHPAITVVGRVPDMGPELARADLAVAPLRSGSGTRLKILESMAHRIPVVSTTLGAEGLDIEEGTHYLRADDPDSFADACQRLLTDTNLRSRLVDAAEERYLQRYEWELVKERIKDIAQAVATPGNNP